MAPTWHWTPRAALEAADSIATELFAHGTMSLEYYAPRGHDPQSPHDRDELYVVVAGRGRFRVGGSSYEFAPGDVLFVPAGVEHRFEEFTEDFATWVVFYGPEGGERP